MTDDSIQREIEANERRARDEQDVGLDENSLADEDTAGNALTDIVDDLFNPEESGPDEDAHEYDDNTKSGQTGV